MFCKKLWFAAATAVVLGLVVVDDAAGAVSVTVIVLLDGNTRGVGVMVEEVEVVEVVIDDVVEDVVVEVEDVVSLDNEVLAKDEV